MTAARETVWPTKLKTPRLALWENVCQPDLLGWSPWLCGFLSPCLHPSPAPQNKGHEDTRWGCEQWAPVGLSSPVGHEPMSPTPVTTCGRGPVNMMGRHSCKWVIGRGRRRNLQMGLRSQNQRTFSSPKERLCSVGLT